MLSNILFGLAASVSVAHAWMPQDHELDAFNRTKRYEALGKRELPIPGTFDKIRGVNFGGWLINEPWMTGSAWSQIGCSGAKTEFDCVSQNFGNDANLATNGDGGDRSGFTWHWANWINPDTVQSVHDVGLNTIRIPIGYWSYSDLVDKNSEHFPDGDAMLPYLDAVVQKASDLGMYVIIDLHGAPGAQQLDPFTGQDPAYAGYPAGFFNDYNYGRAAKWLSWMTDRIHNNPDMYKSVGMIEVLNEPVSRHDDQNESRVNNTPGWDTLTSDYYPQALKAVRDAEAANPNFKPENALTVQFMDTLWFSQPGNQRAGQFLPADNNVAYDDHNYLSFLQYSDRENWIQHTCQDDSRVDSDTPKIVGEWSLATPDSVSHDSNNDDDKAFFADWFTAQQQNYEETDGWIFWSWKTELDDYRWTYSYLTYLKMIPTDSAGLSNNINNDVCSNHGYPRN